MAYAGSCVSAMEKPRSATFVYTRKTRKEYTASVNLHKPFFGLYKQKKPESTESAKATCFFAKSCCQKVIKPKNLPN